MRGAQRSGVIAAGLVTLFLISLVPLIHPPTVQPLSEDEPSAPFEASTLGQATAITVGSWPDGANQRVSISVPDGHAIETLELGIEASDLSDSVASSWTGAGDFDQGSVYDGMDVNGSELALLPQGWTYDFEGVNPFTLGGTNVWYYGADTTLGAGGANSGTSALYTYNGNYPNNMGGPYWATSPVMNCGGCSGAWNLKFMKRLGVESSYYDHAYVSVKSTTGNWVNVWSNPQSTINDGSYTQQTVSITNYVQNNPNFQVRFGLGSSDGSVQYTGWNIDDVEILPAASGISTGEGNWTSSTFGPSDLGRGEERSYGFMHMDATIDPSSVFEWQLLDGQTMMPIPGFEHMTDTQVDLGIIDWREYPSARLQIHMLQGSGGGVSKIRSISFDGQISKTFDTDPSANGWDIQSGAWQSSGVISSSGDTTSEVYYLRSGFSAIKTANLVTGPGFMEVTTDGGDTWVPVDSQGNLNLDEPKFMAQFRMRSSGGTYSWDAFEVELVRTSVVHGLRFDIGLDGISEWSLERNGLGSLGLQDELLNGDKWDLLATSPSGTANFDVALPIDGVDAFQFAVASPSAELSNPFMAMSVNGQDILNRGLSNLQDLQIITLTDAELNSLNTGLQQATNTVGISSLEMATLQIRIGSSLSSGDVLLGGILSPYNSSLTLNLNAADPLVIGLNDALSGVVAVQGEKEITLPVRMDGTGSILLTVNDVQTQASVEPISIIVNNVSNTLVPSNDWIETTSTFDFAGIGVTDAITHAEQSSWEVELNLIAPTSQASIRCPVNALPISPITLSACTSTGIPLIWFDDGDSGSIEAIGSGSFLELHHRFKFPDSWNDEPSAVIAVNLLAPSGPMLPVSASFGLGNDQGVENDISLESWSVLSSNGIRSTPSHNYLRAGEVVNIEVVLGFEGSDEGTPRSGQALVRFLVDGTEYATSSSYTNGVALFPYSIPTGRSSMELGVEVIPLRGQGAVYQVNTSFTFLFDNVAPTLIESDVETFDHRESSPITPLHFTISDRPNLPTHAKAYVWTSWLDDADQDGTMDYDEVRMNDLIQPEDLTPLMDDYSLILDTSDGTFGDYFVGWLEVADSAGHLMAGSGSFASPLFHVQINDNGAPSLGASSIGWSQGVNPWIHPGESTTIQVPIWEKNGIFDIAEINLSLASNTPFPTSISWNQSSGVCVSSHNFINIESCSLIPTEQDDLFSRNGEFVANFSIDWGYDADTSLVRVPHITMLDQTGQSNRFTLEQLGWKFSSEIVFDEESLSINLGDEPTDSLGYWVKPRTTFDLSGSLIWYRTEQPVLQDLDVAMDLGENSAVLEAINGTFSGTIMAPLIEDTYGLTGGLYDAPNGAIYRGDNSAFIWFIVDNQAPQVTAIDRPSENSELEEEDWKNLQFELRLNENARLDESSLQLHWSLNEAGLGINSYVYDNGSLPLEILGERLSGESIPVRCVLDLDELMLPVFRTSPVELRIWVTGTDSAGLQVDNFQNDIDSPLRVWSLEQRVAIYSFTKVEMDPKSDIHQGDYVEVATMISNTGLADGEAQVIVNLVESTGARTQLDARTLAVQSGETILYDYTWKPTRDGTMWLEINIVNGPSIQSSTVRVDEPRSEGVLGSISSVNSSLLVVVGLLTMSLVGLLVYGLRREDVQQPQLAQSNQSPPVKKLETTPSSGPYGAPQEASSPGENPYQ